MHVNYVKGGEAIAQLALCLTVLPFLQFEHLTGDWRSLDRIGNYHRCIWFHCLEDPQDVIITMSDATMADLFTDAVRIVSAVQRNRPLVQVDRCDSERIVLVLFIRLHGLLLRVYALRRYPGRLLLLRCHFVGTRRCWTLRSTYCVIRLVHDVDLVVIMHLKHVCLRVCFIDDEHYR